MTETSRPGGSDSSRPGGSGGEHHIEGHTEGNFITTGDPRRFVGLPTFLRAPLASDADNPSIGIFGVPYDGGTIRTPGTRFGPRGIRNCCWTTKSRPSPSAVMMSSPCRCRAPFTPGTAKVAVVHFDAHTDTADGADGERINHGTMFRRAIEEDIIQADKFIPVGIRKICHDKELDFHAEHGIEVISAEDLSRIGCDGLKRRLARLVGEKVYVSFDIDFVDAAHAPRVDSPELAGPSSSETLAAVRALEGLDMIGFDPVEAAPPYDLRHLTCYLANLVPMKFASMTPPRA